MKKYNTILTIFILYIIVNMVIFPELYISRTLDGISAWAFNVLPSVLPFIFFTKILTTSGKIESFSKVFSKPCKLFFNTPSISSYVFLTSIISGYPVGAKMTSDLYTQGKISKNEAFRMTSFCSTSGPMFIIGAVGIGMLNNPIYGYIILISHILGAIINGFCYKKINFKDNTTQEIIPQHTQSFDLSSIVIDSAISIISIGVIIAIFFVVITSLNPLFNLLPNTFSSILEGTIEITKGCLDISKFISGNWSVIACTFVISFGGISTIFQSISMLNKLKMPLWLFILQKFTHALFSTLVSLLLVFMLL